MNFKEFWESRQSFRASSEDVLNICDKNPADDTFNEEINPEIDAKGDMFDHPNLICHLKKNRIARSDCNNYTEETRIGQTQSEHKALSSINIDLFRVQLL